MHSMRSGFSQVSISQMSLPTKKHLLMSRARAYGKFCLNFISVLSLVMEYADNGDVFQKICSYQKRETYIKEKKIWYIFIQIVRGLKALHDRKILHRDMKSANIFLYRDMQAKLGDLNVSKIVKKGLSYT